MDKQTFIQAALQLHGQYVTGANVKAHLAQLDLIGVAGATGVGKTTLMEKSGLPYVLSDVTREPRKHERNGVDYNFRSDYDQLFRELQTGQFVQYLISETHEFYGTKDLAYPANGPCTMAIFASNVAQFKTLGFRRFTQVYVVPPDFDTWMKRVKSERLTDQPARLHEARQSLELALSDSAYIFLVNDKFDVAIEQFRQIAMGMLPNSEAQSNARNIALKLLTQIVI